MATSAFKSTTKRSSTGGSETTTKPLWRVGGESRPSDRNGVHRRSRSLSRPPSRIPAFNESESWGTAENKHGRFVNTERGSTFADVNLEDLCNEFLAELAKEEETRGRTVQRRSSMSTQDSEPLKRRGRSISRHGRQGEAVSTKGSTGNGTRRRSVSVARYQCSDSESDKGLSHDSFHHSRPASSKSVHYEKVISNKASPSTNLPHYQRGLRRSFSQKDLSKFHDGQSAYSSVITDDEAQGACCNDNGVKTIRAVYTERKATHPDGNVIDMGFYEAMRKEVKQAVAEIRTELHQVMVKGKPINLSGGDGMGLDDEDVLHTISNIKKDFTSKLEQSEKRTQELLAELALEEQRGLELSKIIRELVPSLGKYEPAKHTRTRKRSTDRNRMSKRLTEEAEKYFEDFMSNVEDTDFSSFDDEKSDATLGDNMNSKDVSNNAQKIPLPIDTDGVVLPWLQWETSNDGLSLCSVAKDETVETPPISKGQKSDPSQLMNDEEKSSYSNSNLAVSSRGSCSPHEAIDRIAFTFLDSYSSTIDSTTANVIDVESEFTNLFDMDAYLSNAADEDFLLERVQQRQNLYGRPSFMSQWFVLISKGFCLDKIRLPNIFHCQFWQMHIHLTIFSLDYDQENVVSHSIERGCGWCIHSWSDNDA